MNLIYTCVFHQKSYIKLLNILTNSLFLKGDIGNTDFLIITSCEFQPIIHKTLENYSNNKIMYHLLDVNTIFEAGCSRLHIFDFDFIDSYDKILYLDVDIIINGPINTIFELDINNQDVIYVLEEGNIGHELWGGDFFDFNVYDRDRPAFSSGVIFFHNNPSIRQFFALILNHIQEWVRMGNKIPETLDQPFFIYNAFIHNKYDNQLMKNYVVNNPNDKNDIKIINHFPGVPGWYSSKYDKMMAFWKSINTVAFITLTNTGYIDYTLNCLESLKNNSELELKTYCIGKEGYETLKRKSYLCEYIPEESNSNFQVYKTGNWTNITHYKFSIIYENLLKYDYVCFTDGDIVFENKEFYNYLICNMHNNDALFQSEGDDIEDVCTGFMFIRSNPLTLSIFNPVNANCYRDNNLDDQYYINSVRSKMLYEKLPLHLFPNGKYYFDNYQNINPYMIHFNWTYGHEKKDKMKKHNKWYLNKKVRIFQGGSDGFGHQLEGTLRLISLSLNNKAEYQYKYDKNYSFEHNNFDKTKLVGYITNALDILSTKYDIIEYEENTENVIPTSEEVNFEDIMNRDPNYRNNIYLYDGLGNGREDDYNNKRQLNFDKTLPMLRDAFVSSNFILPKPSYNKDYINVVCHVRLGDAIGTRVLDNDSIYKVVRHFQKQNDKYRVIVHSNGNICELAHENTVLYDTNTDVLQILSDFIHSDIFIMNYSSLSVAAHLLANDSQNVICPNKTGPTFKYRVLDKCIPCNDFLLSDKLCGKTFSWEEYKITFLKKSKMIAFSDDSEYKYIDENVIWCFTGNREHILFFNSDYTEYTSVRKDDHYVVKGHLLDKTA